MQKLKAALSQQLPQVTNGDAEQSRATSQTPPPVAVPVAAPVSPPVQPPAEETHPQSLQQPATSTTETPVRSSCVCLYCGLGEKANLVSRPRCLLAYLLIVLIVINYSIN